MQGQALLVLVQALIRALVPVPVPVLVLVLACQQHPEQLRARVQ